MEYCMAAVDSYIAIDFNYALQCLTGKVDNNNNNNNNSIV